jgi:hypothetical protein
MTIRTLDIVEAASFLKMPPERLMCKASRGEIPAAMLDRRWVFIEEDLVAYLRSQYIQAKVLQQFNVAQ